MICLTQVKIVPERGGGRLDQLSEKHKQKEEGDNTLSADNGTVILKTMGKDGPEFRIRNIQAIDNLYHKFNEATNTWTPNCQFIEESFGKEQVYSSIEDAWDAAEQVEQKIVYSEYGICLVSDFEDYDFSDIIGQAEIRVEKKK